MKKISKILLLTSSLFLVSGCGSNTAPDTDKEPDVPSEPEKPDSGETTPGGNETVTKKDFEGITFEDQEVTYDGGDHTIVATNIPEGATATYTDNGPFKNAGEYSIKLKVTKDGYNDFEKTAKLTIKKATFTNTVADATVTYDKVDHINDIKVVGDLPEGTTTEKVVKLGDDVVEQATNVGEYTFTYTLKNANYNDLVLTAKLTISKATFNKESYKYENVSVEYDGNDHFDDVKFVGILPDTSVGTQVVTKNDEEVTTAIDTGTYNYTYTITDPNYETIVYEATLKITSKEEQLGVVAIGDLIYFANQIHDKYLYSYNTTDGTVEFVSRDVIESFDARPDGQEFVFISKAGFLSAVKTIDTTGKIQTILSENVSEIKYVDADTFVYTVKGLTEEKSAIYTLEFDAEHNPISTKLYQGKAENVTVMDDGIFFTNKGELKFVKFDGTVSSIVDGDKPVKVTEIARYGNKVVVNRNELLGDYIATIELTSSEVKYQKITKDAGKYLNVVGDDLYYSNIDKLNSTLFGAGVYKANLKTTSTDFISTKIIPSESLISNLYVTGNDIYYYHVENKSLYHGDLSQETVVTENLLEGFAKPEPTVVSIISGKNVEYKGKIYYTNVYDDKSLYCYNPANKQNSKITSNTIKDFIIVDDVIYYNEITWLVNNDLYALPLTENSSPVKLSTDDCVDLVKHGDYLYYTRCNASGAATSFERIKLGETPTIEIISETPVENIRIHDNKLYAIRKNKLANDVIYFDLTKEAKLEQFKVCEEMSKELDSIAEFEFKTINDKDTIVFLKSNKISTFDLATNKVTKITSTYKYDSIYGIGEDLYFVTKDGEIGLFEDIVKGTTKIYYKPAIVVDGLLKHPEIKPTSLTVHDGYIYFNCKADNNYHFYRIKLTLTAENQELEQLD